MQLSVKMLLLLYCILLTYSAEGKHDGKPFDEKDLDKIRLGTKGFDKVKTIHTNWYVHSMKALIAQLSRNLLPKLNDDLKTEFVECLAKIHDKKDLVESSKCVMRAREQYKVQRKWQPRRPAAIPTTTVKTPKLKKLSIKKVEAMRKALPKELQFPTATEVPKIRNEVKIQARKVDSHNSEKKNLLEKKRKDLAIARKMHKLKISKILSEDHSEKMKKNERRVELCGSRSYCSGNNLRSSSNKENLILEFKRKWRNQRNLRNRKVLRRSKRSLTRLVVDSVSKSDSHGFFVKNMDRMPSLKTKENKTPVERITKLLRTFFSNQTEADSTWADTYKALVNLKKKMDKKEKESGARVYNERMYDLVLDIPQKNHDLAFFDKQKMPGIVRHAFDLMSTIEGSSKKKGDSNIKFLSPRFAAVMPDKNENRGRLSPSILSFYNDESEDQILPLPKMLDATGMQGKDRDSIIELVMEISGVKGIVHDAMKMLKSTEMPELDLAMDANAKKSLQMVQDIQKSYNRKQKKEIKSNGFTLMKPNQMEKLMTEQGILGRDDIFNLKEYAMMTIGQRKEMVWDMVRGIAFGLTGLGSPQRSNFTSNSRVKRQSSVWGPHILTPTVLSPILFTPIYGLNVLGPTVLSPGLFTPLILNPSVLSPYVFSPTVGIPFILSPYLLSPYVFSPLVMAPFILNPYVLSPNVFNPYVLSPLILSPLVICPDVVSPMTLGGAILSPAVLSPSLLSKSYVMANVLSPTFLS
ncbi:MLt-TeN (mlt-10) related [Caenorhabditis elegans]|uniref:MLt-TeN (Mlt-10) related n=1 Tax=Caenorhabditis elegans TaxID=6239 RepID=O45381_CAEEL|nr:MLt-TeN (mlt-10) related [Caenorhabditis elegans]CAB07585.3 MLt-TeN (mlt-10) related [Caenorhabditis elegans]|eukprot:NP_497038.2 MLt-TeN (mlt-10) related [Caenorhabditis elegans]